MRLHVTGLNAGYGPVRVLHDVAIAVENGEVVTVLGANGAGKTTLLRTITGMIAASRGRVSLDDEDVTGKRPQEIARMGVAHIPQGRGTFSDATVDENLRLGGYLQRDKTTLLADRNRWYEYFPRLKERQNQMAGTLSGGERQMLALARGLMMRPRLLLIDEPSLGLAPKLVSELFEALTELNAIQGTSMLLVEQNATLALRLAQRAYIIEAGQVVLEGSSDEVAASPGVRRAYLGY
jgi:branched-chain amino acid transport system ATP-binding protein